MRRILGPYGGRRGQTASSHPFKQLTTMMKSFAGGLFVSIAVLLFCTFSLWSHIRENRLLTDSQIDVEELWSARSSNGWRPSSVPGSVWNSPSPVKNGYLLVRCNGGLNQQRSATSRNRGLRRMLLRRDLLRHVVGDVDVLMLQEHKIGVPFGNLMRAGSRTF
ncbi:hypothetical protein L7F22_020169 [Adiantum nelumboides]|nr:hypothetical protein [Adiantum nelumboides]